MTCDINKNTVFLFPLSLLLSLSLACGAGSSDKKVEEKSVGQEVIQEGKNLMAQSDCVGCHKEDTKLVGPSYLEIANYYDATEKNIEMLAGKIMKGGQGAWGNIPMAPHPTISEQDAQKMVRYILSLKK